jgi:SAM-dependent methyltransferase
VGGAIRCECTQLPFADGAFALVVIDSLGGALGADAAAVWAEALRVLAPDGHLLVLDQSPWTWLRWREAWRLRTAAQTSVRLAGWMRRAGLAEVRVERALRWMPAPRWVLERWCDSLEHWGERLWPAFGSLYAVSGRKHSNNVIAIPLRSVRSRAGALAAPEGMRRAG